MADIDPATGFYITDTLDDEIRSDTVTVYNVLTKINYAASSRDQVQVTTQVQPGFADSPGIYGLASSGTRASSLTTDLSGKWTSKLNDNKTEIETVVGWHRAHGDVNAIDSSHAGEPLQAGARWVR